MRALLALVLLTGCHALDEAPEYLRQRVEVTEDNLDAAPERRGNLFGAIDLTVTGSDAESAPFLDAIRAGYVRPQEPATSHVTLSCRPSFSASPWNALIAFPGMIPFAPIWLGYGYTARLALDWTIDAEGVPQIEGHRDLVIVFREKNARRSAIFHIWPSTGFFGTQFVLGLVLAPTFLRYDEETTPFLVREIGPRLAATVSAAIARDLARAVLARRDATGPDFRAE
jgi:hypothetical protein